MHQILFVCGLFLLSAQGLLIRHDGSFQPDHILRVNSQNYMQACSPRSSVLVNGSFPGPEIRVQEGQTSWIRVYNDMENLNITMHWHGLIAFTAPFSDGTPMASQWPIPPGHFFDYEVKVEPGYAGTYFYHSHVGFQAVTAAGALIVESTKPQPYFYDEERIIALSDFFSKTDKEIEHGLYVKSISVERRDRSRSSERYSLSPSPMNGTGSCRREVLQMEPGKTYRLRIIGATALSFISFAIESHDVEIIEADGHYTQKLKINNLQIASGQRYSVLLKAKDNAALEQLSQRHFIIQITTLARPTTLTTYAILQYPSNAPASLTDASATPLMPVPSMAYGWLDYQLQPLERDLDFPKSDSVTRRIVIDVHQNFSDHVLWLQSGYDWVETFPETPYLVQIQRGELNLTESLKKAISAGNNFDKDYCIFPAQMGEVLEIVWQSRGAVGNSAVRNRGVETHPFHGHGRHFCDIGGGDGEYNAAENEKRLQETQPVLRDTTVLYGYSREAAPGAPSVWRAWRIRVTNPGVWMMHCHTLQHMIMGMQTVFVFGDQDDIKENMGTYNSRYLTYGGSAYGNETFFPVVQTFF
ncbi:Cupredoxin [Aspergillus tetrazonus]